MRRFFRHWWTNKELDEKPVPATPWSRVWRRFQAHRPARWSLYVLCFLIGVAVLADVLANDKPLVCKLNDQWYFPVTQEWLVNAGLGAWPEELQFINWKEQSYQFVAWPPVPYAARTVDIANTRYVGPFDEQNVKSWYFRHWLGTNRVGRDVLAGLINGTRVAMFIGVLAMSVATIIGLFLGALAGYFGDTELRLSRAQLPGLVLGLLLGLFYGLIVPFGTGVWYNMLLGVFILFGLIAALTWLSGLLLGRFRWWQHQWAVPVDSLVTRLIELLNAIPRLLLLLAVIAILPKRSIFLVMLIIGLLSWTGIARFVRSELLRIRQLAYIDAARALGYRRRRILGRHALPNALTPVLVTVAFGVASAVLLEAFLSFLGIGLPTEVVTWGSMLQEARRAFNAWWLAVFPGLAIFVTVTVFNLIGQGLAEAMDVKAEETVDG